MYFHNNYREITYVSLMPYTEDNSRLLVKVIFEKPKMLSNGYFARPGKIIWLKMFS